MKAVLSIAGSDCSGGAGIQADIKAMTMNGVYAMTAITALTAQNTTGVSAIMEVPPEFLEGQLEMIFEDIPPQAVKIGMIPSATLMETVASVLTRYQPPNIVIDPVMVATSGSALMERSALQTLKKRLFPLAALITPNIPEAQALSGVTIQQREDMEAAARIIWEECQRPVLVKGGHLLQGAEPDLLKTTNDLLYSKEGAQWFCGPRIHNSNTHGTGCTLSSTIATNLAKGQRLEEAVSGAKDYVRQALAAMLDLGQGRGPLNHLFALQ